MAKKRQYTPAELMNDASLRWYPYKRMELVWSDTYNTEMRFVRYEADGSIVLANLMLGELPGSVDPLSVRRPSAGRPARPAMDEATKANIVARAQRASLRRS